MLINKPNLLFSLFFYIFFSSNFVLGSKSVAYWPYRFISDEDSDEILKLFEKIVASGRHVSIMGHYSHYHELQTPVAQEAIRRITSTGTQIRFDYVDLVEFFISLSIISLNISF